MDFEESKIFSNSEHAEENTECGAMQAVRPARQKSKFLLELLLGNIQELRPDKGKWGNV